MRDDGSSDIDIAFKGMDAIIEGALTIIKGAFDTVKELQEPDWTWTLQPWKVSHQNDLNLTMDKHFEKLDRYNNQLQSAISVASYAIGVENLENVLNASKMLDQESLRYRRNIYHLFIHDT